MKQHFYNAALKFYMLLSNLIFLIVPPLWYETWWAETLFFWVSILVIYLCIVYRLKVIKNDSARLEEIIKTRTNSLKNTLTALEESKNQLSGQVHVMSRILASIAHDIQSPLRYISITSSEIPSMIQKGQLERTSQLGSMISEVSKRISNMSRDLLDYVKTQAYGQQMHFEKINLKVLVDKKIEIFKNLIDQNGNQLINELIPEIFVHSDYQLLSIVIHNIIDNATKYTHNGKIRIHYKILTDNRIELIISNSGQELSQKMIEYINKHKEENFTDYSTKTDKVTGLGLLIVKEVSELIGIELRVSQTDVTSFRLFLRRN